MIHDFAAFVVKDLQQNIDDYTAQMVGGVKTWEDYRHLAGLIRGLRLAQDRITDLAKRGEPDDE